MCKTTVSLRYRTSLACLASRALARVYRTCALLQAGSGSEWIGAAGEKAEDLNNEQHLDHRVRIMALHHVAP